VLPLAPGISSHDFKLSHRLYSSFSTWIRGACLAFKWMSVIELGLPWKLIDYGSVQVLHNHFGYGWQRIICNANLLQIIKTKLITTRNFLPLPFGMSWLLFFSHKVDHVILLYFHLIYTCA